DLDWLGMLPASPTRDVLHAARLLDLQRYGQPSLDEVLTAHVGTSKTGESLWAWLAAHRGKGEATRRDQIAHLALAPADLVAAYAEGDVAHLEAALTALQPKLVARGAWDWYLVEQELLPYLLQMRWRGIRVDVEAARALDARLAAEYVARLEDFGAETLPDVWRRLTHDEKLAELSANSGATLARVYDRKGIKYPHTRLGAPSFRKAWLETQPDPFSRLVLRLRKLAKMRGTFVHGYILDYAVKGRVHPLLKQLWPRTLRMSAEHPNEQNIPARDEELAPLVRGLFLPDEGEDWGRCDYSQQEYRLLVHHAVGEGAERAREAYRADRATDFHDLVGSWLGWGPEQRKTVKNANFAKVNRAGKDTFARTLGLPREEADPVFDLYDRALPFVGATGREAQRVAERRGYVRLLLGEMRMYFDHWEVSDWDLREEDKWRTYPTREAALARSRELAAQVPGTRAGAQKAETYKAVNQLIQPGGAQLLKNGMVKLHRAGLTRVLGPALVSVHDELGFSVPRTPAGREAFREVRRVLEGSDDGRCSVPIYVEQDLGSDWGHLEDWDGTDA
ncbi:MAG: DNA polymerase, partial [bacterium]